MTRTALAAILAMACSSDEEDTGSSEGTTDEEDTPAETGDSATDSGDSGDSADSGDSGDTAPVDTGDDTAGDDTAGGDTAEEELTPGRTYRIDFSERTMVEPEGVGTLIGDYIGDRVLVGVLLDAKGTPVAFRIGAILEGTEDTQDTCVPTDDVPIDYSAAPAFAGSAAALEGDFMGVTLELEDVEFSGVVAGKGALLSEGTLTFLLDTVPISTWLDPGGDPGYTCDLASGFGVTCTTCADGSPYCMRVTHEGLKAPEVAGLALVEVAKACR